MFWIRMRSVLRRALSKCKDVLFCVKVLCFESKLSSGSPQSSTQTLLLRSLPQGSWGTCVQCLFSIWMFCFHCALSYVQVVRAVLRMPSGKGQHKAFSTCLPHLAVVSLYSITAMVAYLKPPSTTSLSLGLVVSLLYLVLPSAVKPSSTA